MSICCDYQHIVTVNWTENSWMLMEPHVRPSQRVLPTENTPVLNFSCLDFSCWDGEEIQRGVRLFLCSVWRLQRKRKEKEIPCEGIWKWIKNKTICMIILLIQVCSVDHKCNTVYSSAHPICTRIRWAGRVAKRCNQNSMRFEVVSIWKRKLKHLGLFYFLKMWLGVGKC